MRARALLALAALVPSTLVAQTPVSRTVPDGIIQTFVRIADIFGDRLVVAFDSIPADKYNYRPTPVQQTIGYIAQHLENANYSLCERFGGPKYPRTAKDSLADTVKARWPKDTLVRRLHASLRFCDDAIERLPKLDSPATTATLLAYETDFHFGRRRCVVEIFAVVVAADDLGTRGDGGGIKSTRRRDRLLKVDLAAGKRVSAGASNVPPSNVNSTSPRSACNLVTVASKTLPSPTASRNQERSGRLISVEIGPQATARPCSSIRTCVARRTTSSKSWVTRISGISSVSNSRAAEAFAFWSWLLIFDTFRNDSAVPMRHAITMKNSALERSSAGVTFTRYAA